MKKILTPGTQAHELVHAGFITCAAIKTWTRLARNVVFFAVFSCVLLKTFAPEN